MTEQNDTTTREDGIFLSVLSDHEDYFGNIGFGLSEFAKARRINSVQLTKNLINGA